MKAAKQSKKCVVFTMNNVDTKKIFRLTVNGTNDVFKAAMIVIKADQQLWNQCRQVRTMLIG